MRSLPVACAHSPVLRLSLNGLDVSNTPCHWLTRYIVLYSYGLARFILREQVVEMTPESVLDAPHPINFAPGIACRCVTTVCTFFFFGHFLHPDHACVARGCEMGFHMPVAVDDVWLSVVGCTGPWVRVRDDSRVELPGLAPDLVWAHTKNTR